MSPFLGRDVSCALTRECLAGNHAYLSSVYDDLIALAEDDGIWAYSFATRNGDLVGIDGTRPRTLAPTDPFVAERHRRLMGLYVTTNLLLERNRIWSAKEFASAAR